MNPFSAFDHAMMARALALAAQGLYTTTPNPRVGCVLVKNETVIGEGWHEKVGGPHAEAGAIGQAGTKAAGATLYVTLEPCNHHGRTPPCADLIVDKKIKRVVAAMLDEERRADRVEAAPGREAVEQLGIGERAVLALAHRAPVLRRVLEEGAEA